MRTDCKHYLRRTSSADEVVEACSLDAAPDAPYSCPPNCPLFEKRNVSRAGWHVGSLGAVDIPAHDEPVAAEAEQLFESLESEFDQETVSRIEAEERQRRETKPWWKRRKRR